MIINLEKKINFFFIFFFCLLLYRVKVFKKKYIFIKYFFKNLSFLNFLFFFINRDKFNPVKQKDFKRYIKLNSEKWKSIQFSNENSDETVLVEALINHPAYPISNSIIGNYLKEIHGVKLIGLVKLNDIHNEVTLRSFGIKKFIYLKPMSFFQSIYYIYKSLKILNSKNIQQIIKLKFKGIDVGMPAYDSYIRYTGNPTLEKPNFKFRIFFIESLYFVNFFYKILEDNPNIKKLIQAEINFSPGNNLFQTFLKQGVKIYSKFGNDNVTIRIYNKFSEKYLSRPKIPSNLYKKIYNLINRNIDFAIKNIILNTQYLKKEVGFCLRVSSQKNLQTDKMPVVNRKEILNLFKWEKKKIGVIFFHHLTDINYHHGPRKVFKDNYNWGDFILKNLNENKKVNWILKPHGAENYYKSNFNLKNKMLELENKYSNIKIFPKNINPSSLVNIIDFGITSHGTAASEYPCFGLNVFFSENSDFSNLKLENLCDSKKKLLNLLKNIHKIKKISEITKKKCQVYMFIKNKLFKNQFRLLTKHSISKDLDQKIFFDNCCNNLLNYKFYRDEAFLMFKKQITYDLPHTINFKNYPIFNNILKINDK
jgi:hypothetical protein